MTVQIASSCRWTLLRRLSHDGYLSVPGSSNALAAQIYKAFDNVIDRSSEGGWSDRFNGLGQVWKQEQWKSLSHSGFFAPYYRDRNGRHTSDQKIIYQTCPAFVRHLVNQDHVLVQTAYTSEVQRLDQLLFEAAHEILPSLLEVTAAIVRAEPTLYRFLHDEMGRPILALRVLKYSPDLLAGTNPHVDKSALSCVMHTTDDSGSEGLVFSPPGPSKARLSEFRPALCHESGSGKQAVIFPGHALAQAGFGLLPGTPHAVLPIAGDRPRYSMIVFWLMSGIDVSDFDTTAPTQDDVGILRSYARKSVAPT